jgi:hypothetical protein
VLNKGDKRLRAAQVQFLRPSLGYTKLDHQRNVNIREKSKVQGTVEENSYLPEELQRAYRKDAR